MVVSLQLFVGMYGALVSISSVTGCVITMCGYLELHTTTVLTDNESGKYNLALGMDVRL